MSNIKKKKQEKFIPLNLEHLKKHILDMSGKKTPIKIKSINRTWRSDKIYNELNKIAKYVGTPYMGISGIPQLFSNHIPTVTKNVKLIVDNYQFSILDIHKNTTLFSRKLTRKELDNILYLINLVPRKNRKVKK